MDWQLMNDERPTAAGKQLAGTVSSLKSGSRIEREKRHHQP